MFPLRSFRWHRKCSAGPDTDAKCFSNTNRSPSHHQQTQPPPPVLSTLAGCDPGSPPLHLTSLSVRHFTHDCQLKSPDYVLHIPAVSWNAPLSDVFRVLWAHPDRNLCLLSRLRMEVLMGSWIQKINESYKNIEGEKSFYHMIVWTLETIQVEYWCS